MDDFGKKEIPEEPLEPEKHSAFGNLALLGVLLIFCVVAAYFLSTLFAKPGPKVEDIVKQSPGESSLEYHEPTQGIQQGRPSREELASQEDGLRSISDAIMRYHLRKSEYPESIYNVLEQGDYNLPDDPYNASDTVQPVEPGEFNAGGFSYIPFGDPTDGLIDGFMLVGYANHRENGVTIEKPEELIEEGQFRPQIDGPLIGVAIVIFEGGDPIDLSQY